MISSFQFGTKKSTEILNRIEFFLCTVTYVVNLLITWKQHST